MSSNNEFKFYPYNKSSSAQNEKVKRLKKKFTIIVTGCDDAKPFDLIERARTDRLPLSEFEFLPKYDGNTPTSTYMIEYRGEIYSIIVHFKLYPRGELVPLTTNVLHPFDGMIACYTPEEESSYSVCAQQITAWNEHLMSSMDPKTCFVVAYGKKSDKQKVMESKVESLSKKNQYNRWCTPSILTHETIARDYTSTSSAIEKIVEKMIFQYYRISECADSSDDSDSSDDY